MKFNQFSIIDVSPAQERQELAMLHLLRAEEDQQLAPPSSLKPCWFAPAWQSTAP